MTLATTTINEMLTPNLFSVLAARSGLPDTTVRRGIEGGMSTILDGLAVKARDPVAMNQVADLVERTPEVVVGDRLLDDRTPIRENSSALLGMVTPDSSGIVNRLARTLGVGAGAASALLTAAASLAIAAFRKIGRASGGLTGSTLANSLLDGTPAYATTRHAEPWRREPYVEPRSRAWWLLALIPIALIGFWMWNRGRAEPVRAALTTPSYEAPAERTTAVMPDPAPAEPPQPIAEATAPEAPVTAPETTPMPETTTTPETTTAMTPETTPETMPETTPETPMTEAASTSSFEVDVVEFALGSATIPAESEQHVDSIAQLLQENPSTQVEVAGYADAIGSREFNDNLSKDRAESLRAALIEKGIDESRIETTAHGEERKAVETDRAALVNRRAAVRVSSR